MVHRVKKQNDMHQGKWNGLGGKLEAGESPEQCAVREIAEESGLQVMDLELKGILTFPAFDEIEEMLSPHPCPAPQGAGNRWRN
jgi:8-oxo-dGTP diphosphatase